MKSSRHVTEKLISYIYYHQIIIARIRQKQNILKESVKLLENAGEDHHKVIFNMMEKRRLQTVGSCHEHKRVIASSLNDSSAIKRLTIP